MIRFLLWRLWRLVVVLLVASVLVFSTIYLAPGSPLAVLSGGRTLTEEQIASLTAQYHLDDPLYVRYWAWLTAVLHGDFGASLVSRQPVGSLITERLGTTALLVAYSSLLIVVVGLGLGIWAGARGGVVDTTVVTVRRVLMSMMFLSQLGTELKI